MKKKITKTLAALMCLMTAVAFMPVFAFAADGEEPAEQAVAPAAVQIAEEEQVDQQSEPAVKEQETVTEEPDATELKVQEKAEGCIEAKVTISDKGNVVLNSIVEVTDINENGSFDIDDTLYCAHEQNYPGGVSEGYNSYTGQYGLSLGKLWGDISGSFGYYVNNSSAWSLADEVQSGDYVYAFVYEDGTYWSDSYSYFDQTETEVTTNVELTLVLTAAGYDEEWNPIASKYVGADIKVDGVKKATTDAEGIAKLTFEKPGTYTVTASAKEGSYDILVPPVCKVTVVGSNAEDYRETFKVAKAKEAAINELTECYKLENYRDTVKTELLIKLISGITSINAAVSTGDVEKALRTAKTGLNSIKTDAQMTSEEKAVQAIGILSFSAKAAKKKATVKWAKNSEFDGYQIYYQQAKKGAKYTTTTATSKTIKSLKKKKKYTFKVRGYKKMNGKTIYGKWSSAKTIKIK